MVCNLVIYKRKAGIWAIRFIRYQNALLYMDMLSVYHTNINREFVLHMLTLIAIGMIT